MERNRGWRNIMQSKPVLIFLGILILIFGWNVLAFSNKMLETEKNKKIVEDKVMELRLQKEELSSDINSLNTDKGKEKIFRENFGLAKEGENMIIVVEDKNQPKPQKSDSGGFWGSLFFWKNWFK